MLDVLIVEKDPGLAGLLRQLIQVRPYRRVTDVTTGVADTLQSIDREFPDLALIAVNLAGGENGLDLAAQVNARGVRCLLLAANRSELPVSELALGFLRRPYDCYSVDVTLSIVEKLIAGHPVKMDVALEHGICRPGQRAAGPDLLTNLGRILPIPNRRGCAKRWTRSTVENPY